MRLFVIVFMIITICSGAVYTQPVQFDYKGGTLWSGFREFAVRGDFAYCATVFGLQIFDISDPTSPTLISKYEDGGFRPWARAISLDGDYAYVCQSKNGLAVYDISEPTSPLLVSTMVFPNGNDYDFIDGIDIGNGYAYLNGSYRGVHIIDISDPANPFEIFALNDKSVAHKDVCVSGDYLYLSHGFAGMDITDVSVPTTPKSCGSFNPGGDVYHIRVIGNLAFVAASSYGLAILNISDPYNPMEIGRYDPEDNVYDVKLTGQYAIVSTSKPSLHIVDIGDPYDPAFVAEIPGLGQDFEITIADGYLYAPTKGFQILDIHDIPDYTLAAAYALPMDYKSFQLDGNYAYLCDRNLGLYIVDVSDANSPEFVASFLSERPFTDVAVGDGYAYLEHRGIVDILDVSNPRQPILVNSFEHSSNGDKLALEGSYLYIGADNDGLLVYDITDPMAPALVWTHDCPVDGSRYVETYGGMLCLECIFDELILFDISAPETPMELGSYPLDWRISTVAIRENNLYVDKNNDSLFILDITDPNEPELIGSFFYYNTDGHFCMVDNYAFLTNYKGLLVYDIYNPAVAPKVAELSTPTDGVDVRVVGDTVYLLDEAGFLIYTAAITASNIGDTNGDGIIDVGDAVYVINFIFKGGAAPVPMQAGDANCDGVINIGDAVYVVNYIFKDGPAPSCP